MTTAVNSVSAGIAGFMASAGIGIVPVGMRGFDVAWGPRGSAQDRIAPLLAMDEASVRPMFQPGRGAQLSRSLFANYQRLRAMIAGTPAGEPPALDFIREKALKFAKFGSHDAAAMLDEFVLDVEAPLGRSDAAYLRERTAIAESWLLSLREYSEPASDRIRISRGLLYGWTERNGSAYRPLLLKSMDIYLGSKERIEAAADQLRIALALSEEEPLDADACTIVSGMLRNAATMFADSWERGMETAELTKLADEALKISEGA